jgi:hypothetical protein
MGMFDGVLGNLVGGAIRVLAKHGTEPPDLGKRAAGSAGIGRDWANRAAARTVAR